MADLGGEPRKSKHIQCERGSKRKLTIKTNRAHAKTRQKERESDRKTQIESSKPKRPEAAEAKTNQSFFYWGLSGRMTWGHVSDNWRVLFYNPLAFSGHPAAATAAAAVAAAEKTNQQGRSTQQDCKLTGVESQEGNGCREPRKTRNDTTGSRHTWAP